METKGYFIYEAGKYRRKPKIINFYLLFLFLIFNIGTNINKIIDDILIGMKKTDGEYIIIPDRREAIKYSICNAQEGDVILILGKGHEDYQEIEGVRYPFDERVVIKEILSSLSDEEVQHLGIIR